MTTRRTALGPDRLRDLRTESPSDPTLAELLGARGIPSQEHERVRLAVLGWLESWRDCTPTGADGNGVLDYLRRMAGYGR